MWFFNVEVFRAVLLGQVGRQRVLGEQGRAVDQLAAGDAVQAKNADEVRSANRSSTVRFARVVMAILNRQSRGAPCCRRRGRARRRWPGRNGLETSPIRKGRSFSPLPQPARRAIVPRRIGKAVDLMQTMPLGLRAAFKRPRVARRGSAKSFAPLSIRIDRFAAVTAGQGSIGRHVDVLSHKVNRGIGPAEHRRRWDAGSQTRHRSRDRKTWS